MSTIKTETLSTPSNATVPVDTVVNGTAKAWVNFNGTGTVAIRRAFNVSSITDVSTGQYVINFANAMSDTNYSAVVSSTANGGTYCLNVLDWASAGYTARATSGINVALVAYNASNYFDSSHVNVTIFS